MERDNKKSKIYWMIIGTIVGLVITTFWNVSKETLYSLTHEPLRYSIEKVELENTQGNRPGFSLIYKLDEKERSLNIYNLNLQIKLNTLEGKLPNSAYICVMKDEVVQYEEDYENTEDEYFLTDIKNETINFWLSAPIPSGNDTFNIYIVLKDKFSENKCVTKLITFETKDMPLYTTLVSEPNVESQTAHLSGRAYDPIIQNKEIPISVIDEETVFKADVSYYESDKKYIYENREKFKKGFNRIKESLENSK